MIYEVYELFKSHHEIVRFMPLASSIYYGSEEIRKNDEAPVSYPHIKWVPIGDSYLPPLWQTKDVIIDGKRQQVESCFSRSCGVNIEIYHKDYKLLEDMINIIVNALYDVLESTGNFKVNTGNMMNREQLSQNTVGYSLNISVNVPIYRLIPTVTVESVNVNINPNVG